MLANCLPGWNRIRLSGGGNAINITAPSQNPSCSVGSLPRSTVTMAQPPKHIKPLVSGGGVAGRQAGRRLNNMSSPPHSLLSPLTFIEIPQSPGAINVDWWGWGHGPDKSADQMNKRRRFKQARATCSRRHVSFGKLSRLNSDGGGVWHALSFLPRTTLAFPYCNLNQRFSTGRNSETTFFLL